MPKKNKNNAMASANISPEKLKELGNESYQKGNFSKAVEYYTKALENENIDNQLKTICLSNRALAYYEMHHYEDGVADCKNALIISPTYYKAHYRLALNCLEIDEIDEAKQAIEKIPPSEMIQPFIDLKLKIDIEWKQIHVLLENDEEIIKLKKLIDWLKEGEANFPKLKIRYYAKNYRGVHASRHIKVKEPILFVPLKKMITLEMAKSKEISKKILSAGLDLLSPKHSFLSVFLLTEKMDQNSYWRPYLDTLPSDFDSVPIFFSPEDLKWLEGSPFIEQVKEKKNDMKKDYDNICEVAPEFKNFSLNQFCWARLTASSRIFGIEINNIKTDAFVPLADMLNHRRPKQTTWNYVDEKKGFVIESLEDIERGAQVYDSYGKKCNSRFFLNYGFIVDENDGDEVAIKVEFEEGDKLLNMKQKMTGETSKNRIFKVMASMEETNTIEFFSYLRFVLLQDEAKLTYLYQAYTNSEEKDGYKPQKTPPISLDLEKRVIHKAKELANAQISRYETTQEEDENLLKSGKLTYNQTNCVKLRLGEKKILNFLIRLGTNLLPLLGSTQKELRKAITNEKHQGYTDYVNKIIFPLMTKNQFIQFSMCIGDGYYGNAGFFFQHMHRNQMQKEIIYKFKVYKC